MCPPNWKRIADNTFAAKSSSPRDVNRWKREAVSTGAGAVDSMAARIVQRPGCDDAAAAPHFGDVGEIEIVLIVLWIAERSGFCVGFAMGFAGISVFENI